MNQKERRTVIDYAKSQFKHEKVEFCPWLRAGCPITISNNCKVQDASQELEKYLKRFVPEQKILFAGQVVDGLLQHEPTEAEQIELQRLLTIVGILWNQPCDLMRQAKILHTVLFDANAQKI